MNYQDTHILRNTLYLKEYFKKKTTLVIAVTYGISIVLSILSSIATSINNSNLSFPTDNSPFAESFSDGYKISINFSIPIIPILFFIGFLLLYIKSKNTNPTATPKAGAGVLWGTSIATLVISILASLLILIIVAIGIIVILGIFFGASYLATDAIPEDTPILLISVILLSLFLLCFAAFMITYLMFQAIFQIKFYSSIRKSLRTPVLSAKGSVGFGVMQIINAVYYIFTGMLSLVFVSINLVSVITQTIQGMDNNYLKLGGIILSAFVTFCSFIVNLLSAILTAKFAFGYNKHIKAAGINGENLPMPTAYEAVALNPNGTDEADFEGNVYAPIAVVVDEAAVNQPATAENAPAKEATDNPSTENTPDEIPTDTVYAPDTPTDIANSPAETTAESSIEATDAPMEIEVASAETMEVPTEVTTENNPSGDTVNINLSDLNPEARSIVEEALKSIKGNSES